MLSDKKRDLPKEEKPLSLYDRAEVLKSELELLEVRVKQVVQGQARIKAYIE